MGTMTLSNTTSAIKRLEAIDALDEYAYENALIAFLTVSFMPIFIHEIPPPQFICRTRTHDNHVFFRTIKDISTPPLNVVKGFARCNRPFQSKFYAAETRPTSFVELAENWSKTNNNGDKFYVATGLWLTKKSLHAIIVTTPDEEKRTSDFDKHHGKALDDFIGQYDGEFKESMIIFYRFLFERFRKPAVDDPLTYIITTAYCNLALAEANGRANCIFYPSVPFAGQGVNFAINSDFIKLENIELQQAMCNEMTFSENENKEHIYTESNSWTAKQIVFDNDKIEWLET